MRKNLFFIILFFWRSGDDVASCRVASRAANCFWGWSLYTLITARYHSPLAQKKLLWTDFLAAADLWQGFFALPFLAASPGMEHCLCRNGVQDKLLSCINRCCADFLLIQQVCPSNSELAAEKIHFSTWLPVTNKWCITKIEFDWWALRLIWAGVRAVRIIGKAVRNKRLVQDLAE